MLKKKLKYLATGFLFLAFLGIVYAAAVAPEKTTLTPAGSNGLLGYWKLGESDAIGNEEDLEQHLFSSAGFGPDIAGKTVVLDAQGDQIRPIQPGRAYNFDGSNDYVDIADSSDLQIAGDISVSFWIKYPAAPSVYSIVATKHLYTNTTSNSGWEIGILSDGKIIIKSAENAGMLERVKSTNNLDDDKWHHVTFTRDTNNSWKLYIDNDLNASATGTDGDISGGNEDVRIGQGVGTPSYSSKIKVFDFRIFKEVLSDGGISVNQTAGGDIAELYNHDPSVATTNLVAHYKMDEGSGITAYDSSGKGHHGTLDANGSTNAGSGTAAEIAAMHTTQNEYSFQNEVGYSGALDFDGTDDYVNLGIARNSITVNNTFSAWFKFTGKCTDGYAPIFGTRGTDLPNFFVGKNSGGCSITLQEGNNLYPNIGEYITPNAWQHIVYRKQDGLKELFVDNVKSFSESGSSGGNTANNISIGSENNELSTYFYFTGQIADVRIFKEALSDGGASVGGTANGEIAELYDHNPSVATTNLVGHWKLNEMSGTTAFDSSPNVNNGTLCNNTACPSTSGPQWHSIPRNEKTGETTNDVAGKTLDYSGRAKYNARLVNSNAATFDGDDDYIKVPDYSGTAVSKLTVSAWVKTNDLATDKWGAILAKDTDSPSYRRLYWFGLNEDEKLYLSPGTYDGSNYGAIDYYNDSITLNVNTWHHVAATYKVSTSESNNVKIYLDGTLIKEATHAQGTLANNIEHVHIGRSINGHYFNGEIADVRIFDEILTAAQIKEISQGKVNVVPSNVVGWWPLAEGAGSTAYDASGGGNNGVVYNGTSVMTGTDLTNFWSTKQDVFHYNIQKGFATGGKALSFDGTDDYVKVDDPGTNSSLDLGALTISAWVKVDGSDGWQGIVTKDDTTTGDPATYRNYWFGVDAFERLSLSYSMGGEVRSDVAVGIEEWHHVVASYTGTSGAGNVKLYIDGVLQTKSTNGDITKEEVHNDKSLYIGKSMAGHDFDGQIADVRIFNAVLGDGGAAVGKQATLDSDIGKLYAKQEVATSNLVGWWKLDEGTGATTANDSSSNSNNGAVTGAAWYTEESAVKVPSYHNTATLVANPFIYSISNPAGVWHNNAETKFENYSVKESGSNWLVAPALFQADKINDNCTTCTSGTGGDGFLSDITTGVSKTLTYGNIAATMGDKGYFVAIPEAKKKRDLKIFGSSPILTRDSSDQEKHFKYAENTEFPGFSYTNDHKGNPKRAITFDGNANRVLSLGTSINGLQSINFWLKKGANNNKDLIKLSDSANLKIDGTGKIIATGFSPTIYLDSQTSNLTISDTNWHMVTITTSAPITADDVKFGAVTTAYFDGSMDEVRFYSGVLDQRKIDVLHEKIKVILNSSQNGLVTDDLIGLWSFNGPDISGTTVYDRNSGTAHNGTISGATPAIGKIGQGLKFDGTDDIVTVGNVSGGSANLKSINLWLKKGTNNNKDLIKLSDSANLTINASGTITATGFGTSPTIYLDSVQTATPTILDTNWHMVTITIGTDITDINANDVKFGAVGTTDYFDGSMDEVRFYDKELDADKIKSLYNFGSIVVTPSP